MFIVHFCHFGAILPAYCLQLKEAAVTVVCCAGYSGFVD